MAKIYASYAAAATERRTYSPPSAAAGEQAWLDSWAASSASDAFYKYPPDSAATIPWGWWYPEARVGLTRGIVFFDTTGISRDMSFFAWNAKSGPPCYSGTTGESYYILSGNGISTGFDESVYGLIKGRFSSEYLITTKPLDSIYCLHYGEIVIPASFINSSGYTVLCVVLGRDYLGTSVSSPGQRGAYLLLSAGNYLDECGARSGYLWVEGTKLAYLALSKLTKEGTTTGDTGTAGYVWVEGTYLHYIDSSGDERRIEGSQEGATGKTGGHIWVEDTKIRYIDSSGNERYIEGT